MPEERTQADVPQSGDASESAKPIGEAARIDDVDGTPAESDEEEVAAQFGDFA